MFEVEITIECVCMNTANKKETAILMRFLNTYQKYFTQTTILTIFPFTKMIFLGGFPSSHF